MSSPRAAAGLGLALALGSGGQILGQSSAAGGGVPGETRQLSFGAALSTALSHRETVSLEPDGSPGQSGRATLGMTWSLVGSRTSLFASLSPYYERFFESGGFSTYGGSAGIGISRRVTSNYSWNFSSTITAAPDQDIPPPATSEAPAAPEVRPLVPRNGFVSGSLQFGHGFTPSPRTGLEVALNASLGRFSVYDAGQDGVTPGEQLVDSRSMGLTMGTSIQSSQRNTWSVSVAINHHSLDNGGSGASTDDGRSQASLSGSFQRVLSPRSNFSLGSGMSSIETGTSGRTASTPTLSATYSLRGDRVSSSFTLGRSQGIFPASRESVDSTSLAANVALNTWQRASLSFGAGYNFSSRAEDSGGWDSRTRSFNARYSLARRLLGWSVAVSHARQNTDASLSRSLEFTSLTTALLWRIAGRGGSP